MPFKVSVFQQHLVSLQKHHNVIPMLQHARRGYRTCWSWGLGDICGSFIQNETYLLGVGHLLRNEPVSIDITGKSALKMANLHAQFKGDTPKASKDIALQRRDILQTFVCREGCSL